MSGSTLPDLDAGADISGADLFYTTQSGANKKVTGTQIKEYASVPPSPFFGTALQTGWTRPGLDIGGSGNNFTLWLNQGGQAIGVGDDNPPADEVPVTPGTGYAENDTITLAGGTVASDGNLPAGTATVLTVDTVDGGGGILAAHISDPGRYSVPPTGIINQSSTSGIGTGATWKVNYLPVASATDNTGGLPLVISSTTPPGIGDLTVGCLTGLLKAVGSPPWIVTDDVASFWAYANSDQIGVAGLILYNSDNDEAIVFGGLSTNASGTGIQILHYTNVSNLLATTVEGVLPGTPGTGVPYVSWWRIENDGASIIPTMSAEGIAFIRVFDTGTGQSYSEALSDFITNVTHVGFGLDRFAFSGDVLSILWNWVQTSP